LPARLAAAPPSGPLIVLIGRVFAETLEAAVSGGTTEPDVRHLPVAQRN
jgi:hypothetical protein